MKLTPIVPNSRLTPVFIQRPKRPTSLQEAIRSSVVAKKNISSFCRQLFAYEFGGRTTNHERYARQEVEDILDRGTSLPFLWPDISISTPSGEIKVELKASSRRNSKWIFPSRQLYVYLKYMRDKIQSGQTPFLKFALVKYGNRQSRELHKHTHLNLLEVLCEDEFEFVVLPINLMVQIYPFLRKKDSEGRDSPMTGAHYFEKVMGSNTFTRLFQGVSDAEVFHRLSCYCSPGDIGFFTPQRLGVDKLVFDKYKTSASKCVYRGKEFSIRPIPVTEYHFSEPLFSEEAFADYVYRDFNNLCRRLGIANGNQEGDVPI